MIVLAFSEEQTADLTGISRAQLRDWDRSGFFQPSFASEDRGLANSRIYSFRDLTNLRVLSDLRISHGVSLRHLKKVKKKLEHLGDDIWTKTKLYVLKKKVAFKNPKTHRTEEIVSGQGVFEIALGIIQEDMVARVEQLRNRTEDEIGRFERRRNVAHNKEVIAGTRIPVNSVLAFHEAGYSVRAIINEYPSLKEEDVKAVIAKAQAA